jgi:hypothetical protein
MGWDVGWFGEMYFGIVRVGVEGILDLYFGCERKVVK